MPGRASGIRMVEMAKVGAPISQDGWQSIWIVGASAYVIFILLHKKIKQKEQVKENERELTNLVVIENDIKMEVLSCMSTSCSCNLSG